MTKAKSIEIKAGPKALSHIRNNGFDPKDIKSISAAAGGPKWFVIYHLTRYIAESLMPHTEGKIQLLGSSVGAWQMACLATQNPGAALERLRDRYAGEIYQMPISTHEISRGCRSTLDHTFSDKDIENIMSNDNVNLNIFAARGKGILRYGKKYTTYPGLLYNYLTNAVSRKLIRWSFDRYIFSTHMEMPIDQSKSILSTDLVKLDDDNFRDVLMATAAIPLVMNPVKGIKKVENATFYDGGLTDYHMVLPYRDEGLVLIPHFLPELSPGWMDKSLKYRRGKGKDLSNVVMIHPSKSYIDSLPKGKISTRDDFIEFGEDQKGRAEYWIKISEQGMAMREELDHLIQTGSISDIIEEL